MDISPSAAIFVTLLAGLSAVAFFHKSPEPNTKTKKEGFLNQPLQPSPVSLSDQQSSITDSGKQLEYSPLPGAPFGQVANSAPLPYKNPVMQNATLFQINSLLEDLRGFLGFEAKSLEERSDPSIQLPLTRAKADFQRLTDEFHVLSATPGIQSQLNQQDILSIRSNLRYLQRESRTINATEGFTGTSHEEGAKATRDELNQLVIKIYAEMQRLGSSGTSDPVTQARLTALTNMRLDVQSILQKLDSGDMQAADIPIYESDIQKVLPLLSNVNQPLPVVLQKAGLSPMLASLLPVKAGSKESDYLVQNQKVLSAALDKLVKGLSWSIEYTSENKARAGSRNQYSPNDQTLFATGFPSNSEIHATSNPVGANFSPVNSASGISSYPIGLEQQRLDALSATQGQPGTFDWKQRAKDIRQAIQKRGMDPNDFGCLTPEQESSVSPTFSWRGYAKMVCNRLTTTMDPGLPETCGCPPEGWLAWSK